MTAPEEAILQIRIVADGYLNRTPLDNIKGEVENFLKDRTSLSSDTRVERFKVADGKTNRLDFSLKLNSSEQKVHICLYGLNEDFYCYFLFYSGGKVTILTLRAHGVKASDREKELNDKDSTFRADLNAHLLDRAIENYSGLYDGAFDLMPESQTSMTTVSHVALEEKDQVLFCNLGLPCITRFNYILNDIA